MITTMSAANGRYRRVTLFATTQTCPLKPNKKRPARQPVLPRAPQSRHSIDKSPQPPPRSDPSSRPSIPLPSPPSQHPSPRQAPLRRATASFSSPPRPPPPTSSSPPPAKIPATAPSPRKHARAYSPPPAVKQSSGHSTRESLNAFSQLLYPYPAASFLSASWPLPFHPPLVFHFGAQQRNRLSSPARHNTLCGTLCASVFFLVFAPATALLRALRVAFPTLASLLSLLEQPTSKSAQAPREESSPPAPKDSSKFALSRHPAFGCARTPIALPIQ